MYILICHICIMFIFHLKVASSVSRDIQYDVIYDASINNILLVQIFIYLQNECYL